MGGYNNPVLNGIFRGLQLASLVQNQRVRQQNAQSLEGARQEAARRNTALEARQAALNAERAQEKVRDFRLRARESGAVPLDPSQTQAFRRGEDFSVELAPGLATTASASAIEGPGGGLFAFPGPVEKGVFDLDRRLEQYAGEQDIRARNPVPLAAARSTDDEGNVHFLDPRTGAKIATVPGVGKKSGSKLGETPSERRARVNFERGETERQTSERVQATASILLDDAGGDPEAALDLLEQEITRPGDAERSEFLRRQRIAIRQLLKGARTDGAAGRPREPNSGDQVFMDLLAVDFDELERMRAISRDMPLKLARAVDMVRNEPPPDEPNLLARIGLAAAPRRTTIEEALDAQQVGPEDIALLKAAGIDVARLGQRRSRSPLQAKTEASRRGKGATLKAAPARTPASGGGAAQEWQRYKSKVK